MSHELSSGAGETARAPSQEFLAALVSRVDQLALVPDPPVEPVRGGLGWWSPAQPADLAAHAQALGIAPRQPIRRAAVTAVALYSFGIADGRLQGYPARSGPLCRIAAVFDMFDGGRHTRGHEIGFYPHAPLGQQYSMQSYTDRLSVAPDDWRVSPAVAAMRGSMRAGLSGAVAAARLALALGPPQDGAAETAEIATILGRYIQQKPWLNHPPRLN